MHKSLALIALLLVHLVAFAVEPEANIKAGLQKRRPDIIVDSVTKTPIPGIYEVYAGGNIYYTDQNARYLLDGQLVDLERKVSVTDERMIQLTAVKFDQLPLDLALKRVKGNGARTFVYFGDPDCPFCRKLEQELTKVDNITIYTFVFPITELHPNAEIMARKIWCSKDPATAWTNYMLNSTPPLSDGDCATPIEKTRAYAQKLRIDATPTMVFADGRRIPGSPSAAQLELELAKAQSKNNRQ
jgi:thiol:disulfide interchange protein DsbC